MSHFLDFSGKTVLITGGTRGIGLETGLSFAKRGALCVLTYSWGDHDEKSIYQAFEKEKAPKPILLQADVSNDVDTQNLLDALKKQGINQIDIFISNVSAAQVVNSFEDYSLKGLKKSISYSAFPMVAYTKKIHSTFGKYPKYIMGVSSTGPTNYSIGYDYVAASKTVMEIFVKYLNYRLRQEGVCINAVRSRAIKTQSLENTFGKDLAEFTKKYVPDNYWIQPQELSEALVALCSGYCDSISGQIITVDKGTTFFDNLMEIYTRAQKVNRAQTSPKA
ncbi:MAG: SDR family oxidoreductase [Bacteroidetes bacterium]|nr:SDR family oxidoreductase [Bacteroidota bacterium]